MQIQPHIKITETTDGIVLEVEDYELFDFIDDYLVEQGIWSYFLYPNYPENNLQEVEVYKVCFPKKETVLDFYKDNLQHADFYFPTKEKIIEALSKLSPEEIEEIFCLNNPKE